MDGVNFKDDVNVQSIQQLNSNSGFNKFDGQQLRSDEEMRPKTGSTQVTKQMRTGQANVSLQGDLETQDGVITASGKNMGVFSQSSKNA